MASVFSSLCLMISQTVLCESDFCMNINAFCPDNDSWPNLMSTECSISTHAHTHTHTRARTHTYTRTHARARTRSCARTCTHTRMRTHVHTHRRKTRTRARMCARTRAHTHTHTRTPEHYFSDTVNRIFMLHCYSNLLGFCKSNYCLWGSYRWDWCHMNSVP